MINVAMAFDENYVRYAYVAILSILKNRSDGDKICFYIMQSHITEASMQMLKDMVHDRGMELVYIDVDENRFPETLPRAKGWPLEIYYRLMLPEVLADSVDRILYLDADIIVNGSLSELFDTDLEGKLICGTENFAPIRQDTYKNQELLYAIKDRYMCSGLLLLDLKGLKDKGYTFDKYMDIAKKLNYELVMPDMDLLNFAHRDDFKAIDRYRYNLFASEAFGEGIRADKAVDSTVIQYAGYKPWQGGHIHYDTEGIWWKYAKETPFYHEFLEKYVSESIDDPFVYESIKRISKEKQKLAEDLSNAREELKLRKELNDKLLSMVGADNLG